MHFQRKENIKKAFDRLLSPPPNFANLTYNDRVRNYINIFKSKKDILKNLPGFLKLITFLIASIILIPVALLLKLIGYRFVNIDMSQIGSVVYLDLLLREDKLTKNTPRHKILVLASHYTDGNTYLMDLYKKHCIYVRNPLIKLILAPFFVSFLFKDNSFKYDFVLQTEPICIAHDIWNDYHNKYQKPLIEFPESDKQKCEALFSRYIDKNAKIVALHTRDSGYYDDPQRATRNADILRYKKAIQYLIKEGYTIVRLGHPTAKDISTLITECGPKLFDYAYSDIRSEMMDCYLLSQCAFFVGLASGPSSVPMLFNVNSCNINWHNASNATNFLPNDLSSFKKFYYKKDKSLVPFKKLMHPPYSLCPNTKMLDPVGVYVEELSEDDVYKTVKEYLEDRENRPTELQLKAKSMILKNNYGYKAKGHISNTILKYYEDEILQS